MVFAAFATVGRRRRRVAQARATLPRGLVQLISAVALPVWLSPSTLFFFGDVMVRLHLPERVADLLVIGSQWAAVLMGACWALRALAALVNRAVTGRRASGRQAPPEGANLAPIDNSKKRGAQAAHDSCPSDGRASDTLPSGRIARVRRGTVTRRGA